jgi:polysaccharide export outer membrane protein
MVTTGIFTSVVPSGTMLAQTDLPFNTAQPRTVSTYSLGTSATTDSTTDSSDTQPRVREDYKLRIGDKLQFKMLNDQYGFDNTVIIDNQGMINLDHLEWFYVLDMTVRKAQEEIKKAYEKDYFTNPRVKLSLLEKANLRFKILGQVANPGFYEVPPGLDIDLLDAIAIAGGYTRIAGKVIFKDPKPNGEETILTYKIKELTKDSKVKIPELNGDETIIIGESIF